MALDMNTIDQNLAKARADVEFWEKVKEVFSDPRIAGPDAAPIATLLRPRPVNSARGGYGDQKRSVFGALPDYGQMGRTSAQLIESMKGNGYVFVAKYPIASVNDSLKALADEGKATVVGKDGVANLWTKTREGGELVFNR